MANQEQLAILCQGVGVWNAWRKEHPTIERDLQGANLTYTNLTYTNLTYTNLTQADLDGASLDGANLTGASLDGLISQGPASTELISHMPS